MGMWREVPRDLKRLVWSFIWEPPRIRYPTFISYVQPVSPTTMRRGVVYECSHYLFIA